MKLLKKNEIQQLKSAAEKQAVDEGVKLAKRVDRLREVASQEETSLEQFRTKTVAAINQEIQTLSVTKDTLLSEVKELEEKRKSALEPLDAEWQRLTAFQAELQRQADEINIKLEELNALSEATTASVLAAEGRIAHINTLENVTESKAIEADNFYCESKSTLLEARDIKAEAERYFNEKTKELTNRELVCANAENSIILREKELEKERKELLNERKRLEDRSRTLERAFNRLKK